MNKGKKRFLIRPHTHDSSQPLSYYIIHLFIISCSKNLNDFFLNRHTGCAIVLSAVIRSHGHQHVHMCVYKHLWPCAWMCRKVFWQRNLILKSQTVCQLWRKMMMMMMMQYCSLTSHVRASPITASARILEKTASDWERSSKRLLRHTVFSFLYDFPWCYYWRDSGFVESWSSQ